MLLSCNLNSEKKNTETVKVFAQDRPGGDPSEYDMPIEKGLDNLKIIEIEKAHIDDDDLILGIEFGTRPIAIPIRYLSGFEIANIVIDQSPYLLTWCPLVGSARIFNGMVNGDPSGFDIGHGLINDNLLIIDRKTKSVWSQLSSIALSGSKKGDQLSPLASIQSTWAFWKSKHPNTLIAINKNSSGAAFPNEVFDKYYYSEFVPGDNRRKEPYNQHHTGELGIGVNLSSKVIFFPFRELQKGKSPVEYNEDCIGFLICYNLNESTAWAEKKNGELMENTIVYQKSWMKFYPNSKIYSANDE